MNQARVWGMVLALGAARALGAQDVGLAVGQKAPAAVVQDLDGKTVDLGRFIGHRPVLVEFWATWCPLCKALEPTLKSAHARYGRQVEFLAIGVGVNESPGSIRRHLAEHPLPFPVLYDATGAAVRAFAAPTTSYIVVLDRAGLVTYTGTGVTQDLDAALKRLAAE
ncbi:MAG TPA: TlpA disulfide reductase family protein [Gemmatimonadales bacterium]|nr:TlpA disulfide reductase family protein [Gemmatimonadales bacterium]